MGDGKEKKVKEKVFFFFEKNMKNEKMKTKNVISFQERKEGAAAAAAVAGVAAA